MLQQHLRCHSAEHAIRGRNYGFGRGPERLQKFDQKHRDCPNWLALRKSCIGAPWPRVGECDGGDGIAAADHVERAPYST